MTIIKRTCTNCAAFNPSPTGEDPTCWNLVSFTEQHGTPQALTREPGPHDHCNDHLTHDESTEQTAFIDAHRDTILTQAAHEAELEQHRRDATPEFMAAMSACLRLGERLGLDHPDTAAAMMRAMSIAPPSMRDFMAAQANELGLIPEAVGYTTDGEPVFSLESIAAKLDMTMPEAQAAMDAMLTERAALGLPAVLVDPATVHRVQ